MLPPKLQRYADITPIERPRIYLVERPEPIHSPDAPSKWERAAVWVVVGFAVAYVGTVVAIWFGI